MRWPRRLGSAPCRQKPISHRLSRRPPRIYPEQSAIDAGNNLAELDQRGNEFARVVLDVADIGAFEVQGAGDTVFQNGFAP